jgi:squalene-associated FAD-dependent desaturase
MRKVIIVGAGWAGLSCAYELLKHGVQVTILEAAPQAGGRARGVKFGDCNVDNGQHLLIGGYQQTLKLITELSSSIEENFFKQNFEIFSKKINPSFPLLKDNVAQDYYFKLITSTTKVKSHKINLLTSLIKTYAFSLKDKIIFLKFSLTMIKKNFKLKHDISAEQLLASYKFSKQIISNFFEPMIVSTMTTPMHSASAQIFLNIMQATFFTHATFSNLLFAKKDLTSLFVTPIVAQILKLGGDIKYNHRVKQICLAETPQHLARQTPGAIEIHSNDEILKSDFVVLATQPWQTSKVIENISALASLNQALQQITFESIINIYFEFASPVHGQRTMTGVINGYTHWIFSPSAGNSHIACAVISAPGEDLKNLSKEQIIKVVSEELTQIYPHLPTIINIKYIQEKRAAFSCTPHINALRPTSQTKVANLFIAGDYINTGYPSTLEGAVISGQQAARAILNYCAGKLS